MDLPRVSVIIPAKNEEGGLGRCLDALRASAVEGLEILVVDDHSTDSTAEVAAAGGARVVALKRRRGVSAARNAGAATARGEMLVFTDADVAFRKGALRALVGCAQMPGVHGAVGVQSRKSPFRNFASRWKNQWMRHTYRIMPERVALFYTSVAAIRAEVFEASGGFDESNYAWPSVEDTAFGRRLAQRGCDVRMCRDAEVDHVKHYSLAGLLATDYRRARALVRLALRERRTRPRADASQGRGFSVPVRYPLGALALCGALALLPAALISSSMPALALCPVLCVLAFSSCADFLACLWREQGPATFLRGLVFWPLDCVSMVLGAAAGALGFVLGKHY